MSSNQQALRSFDAYCDSLPSKKRAAVRQAYEKARETHNIAESIRIALNSPEAQTKR